MSSGTEYGLFWGETLSKEVVPKEPIIEYFLYTNDIIVISADSGIGKSILALQIALNLTTTEPFLDVYNIPKPCNVLYVQTEGDRAETLERLEALQGRLKFDRSRFFHLNFPGLRLNRKDGLAEFLGNISLPDIIYNVIIIDPLYTTVQGSMAKDDVATDWIRNVRSVKNKFQGCAIIILHHEPKEQYYEGKTVSRRKDNLFGSIFWTAFVSYNWKFSVSKGVYLLDRGKARNTKTTDILSLKLLEPYPLMFVQSEEDLTLAEQKTEMILRGKKSTAKELQAGLQMSKASVFRILKKLQLENKVKKEETKFAPTYEWLEKVKI